MFLCSGILIRIVKLIKRSLSGQSRRGIFLFVFGYRWEKEKKKKEQIFKLTMKYFFTFVFFQETFSSRDDELSSPLQNLGKNSVRPFHVEACSFTT